MWTLSVLWTPLKDFQDGEVERLKDTPFHEETQHRSYQDAVKSLANLKNTKVKEITYVRLMPARD